MVTSQVLESGLLASVTALVLWQCAWHPSFPSAGFVSVFMAMQCLVLISAQSQRPQLLENPKSLYRQASDEGLVNILLVPLAVLADHLVVLKHGGGRLQDSGYVLFALLSTAVVTMATLTRAQDGDVKSWLAGRPTFGLVLEVVTSLWLLPLAISLDGVRGGLLLTLGLGTFLAVRHLPVVMPRSLTPGEASLCVQLASLTVWRVLTRALNAEFADITDIDIVATLGLVGVLMATALLWLARDKVFGFYLVFPTVAVSWLLPALVCLLDVNPVSWLLTFLSHSWTRMLLLLCWGALAVVAALVVAVHAASSHREWGTTLAARKVFHLLVTVVYLSGLAYDLQFLYLASVVALAVFILIEVVRVHCIPPFGKELCRVYEMFRDDRDQGDVILTNIYLLVGMSLPIWMTQVPASRNGTLPLYAGLLSLGVGDAVASLGGILLGTHRWPGSSKTVEGSLCSVGSQILVVGFLIGFGVAEPWPLWNIFAAVILSTLHEATTSQIDNLILPLTMFSLLSLGQPEL